MRLGPFWKKPDRLGPPTVIESYLLDRKLELESYGYVVVKEDEIYLDKDDKEYIIDEITKDINCYERIYEMSPKGIVRTILSKFEWYYKK